jgi:rhomboid family GlyGly-CTERM serine protease
MTSAVASRASSQGRWAICLGIALAAGLFMFVPEELLRYERQEKFTAESWRLLTAHLVHLSTSHLFFNLAGLALICELFWKVLPVRHGVAVLLVAACVIDLSLWHFHPEVQWYAGLSGVTHALWAACVTALISQSRTLDKEKHRLLGVVGAALLLLKIAAERMDILIPAAGTDGFPVIEVAHSYGALTGMAYVLLWRQCRRLRSRK